jgi:hypothetical protein
MSETSTAEKKKHYQTVHFHMLLILVSLKNLVFFRVQVEGEKDPKLAMTFENLVSVTG